MMTTAALYGVAGLVTLGVLRLKWGPMQVVGSARYRLLYGAVVVVAWPVFVAGAIVEEAR